MIREDDEHGVVQIAARVEASESVRQGRVELPRYGHVRVRVLG